MVGCGTTLLLFSRHLSFRYVMRFGLLKVVWVFLWLFYQGFIRVRQSLRRSILQFESYTAMCIIVVQRSEGR